MKRKTYGPFLNRILLAVRRDEPYARVELAAYLRTYRQLHPLRGIRLWWQIRREIGGQS